ncbi:MAG: transcription-repair coupling factor, partial [Planctomycetaceae bacterium]
MTAVQIDDLTALVSLLETTPGFEELVAALDSGNSGTIDGAWGSSSALAMATLSQRCDSTMLVVLPREADLDDCVSDLESWCGETPAVFPAWASLPQESDMTDAVFGRRLRILRQLNSASPPGLVVATIAALLQPVPARHEIKAATRRLAVGDQLDENSFCDWLTGRGFESVTGIRLPGEFAVRGGIIDVFPPDADDPCRIEFFGDEIESIRQFDVGSQRTVATLDAVEIVILGKTQPAHKSAAAPQVSKSSRTSGSAAQDDSGHLSASSRFGAESFFDTLPGQAWVVLSELTDISSEGQQYLER